ncbi:conserved hypothetical protein [Thermotomaculum hydrothermale]|uniref:DUF1648 domain-containing protein n=1 Tax=Thermotomaculum hydrothermale TaxID=981385 RepID=A0A7R6PNW2_9BACT|nr:DUF1648 domain-containing protein [Thermotomaculum hydrothermale]BBB33113.1 conserved hypothetical protein [Thermotomaculum hydrothermale]
MANLPIKEIPLSKRGNFFLYASLVFSFLILIFGVYAYFHLPEKVAVHFGLNGQPDRFGNKTELLGISILFFVISFLFSLFVYKRYYLFEKFPYLINIPAFYIYAQKLNEDRQSVWIAQYFEFLAILMFLVNLMLFIILYFIYLGALNSKLPYAFNFFLFPYIIFLLSFTFGYLFNMYKKIKKEAESI